MDSTLTWSLRIFISFILILHVPVHFFKDKIFNLIWNIFQQLDSVIDFFPSSHLVYFCLFLQDTLDDVTVNSGPVENSINSDEVVGQNSTEKGNSFLQHVCLCDVVVMWSIKL